MTSLVKPEDWVKDEPALHKRVDENHSRFVVKHLLMQQHVSMGLKYSIAITNHVLTKHSIAITNPVPTMHSITITNHVPTMHSNI